MRPRGPHPLSLGYTAPGLREIFHSWGSESHTQFPGMECQFIIYPTGLRRLQKPKAQGRKGALNSANTRWLVGVGQYLEWLCFSSFTAPPPLSVAHQHLVPCCHLGDRRHPRASSSPIEAPTPHLLPLNFTPLPYLGLCALQTNP